MIAVSCMSVITIILFFGDNNVNLLLHRTDTIHIQMQRRQRWRWGHRRHRKRHSTTSIESAFIFEVRARVEWTRYFWSLDEIKSQFYNLFFFLRPECYQIWIMLFHAMKTLPHRNSLCYYRFYFRKNIMIFGLWRLLWN